MLVATARAALNGRGFAEKGVRVKGMLSARFDGTDTSVTVTQSGKATEDWIFHFQFFLECKLLSVCSKIPLKTGYPACVTEIPGPRQL